MISVSVLGGIWIHDSFLNESSLDLLKRIVCVVFEHHFKIYVISCILYRSGLLNVFVSFATATIVLLFLYFFMQILEGLLKLPENRECADCWSKYLFQNPILMFSIMSLL